jgi:hypothetical protein
MRYARKVDNTQAEIVAALRKCGVLVEIIHEPVDLLTYYRGRFLPLECKNFNFKRPRSDQARQNAFIDATGTPRVKSAAEAIYAVTGGFG